MSIIPRKGTSEDAELIVGYLKKLADYEKPGGTLDNSRLTYTIDLRENRVK